MYIFSKEDWGVKTTLTIDDSFKVQEVTVSEVGKGDFFKIGRICSETKVLLSSCIPNRLSLRVQRELAEKIVEAYYFIGSTVDLPVLLVSYKREGSYIC